MSALLCAAAAAEPVSFGARVLQIQPPENFAALARRAPQTISTMQAFVPDSMRVIDVYTTPALAAALEKGQQQKWGRYFTLQVLRSDDGKPSTFALYWDHPDLVETELRHQFENAHAREKQLAAQASQRLNRSLAETSAGVSDSSEFLGITHKEPWGLFYAMKTKDKDGSMTFASNAIVDINYQVVALAVYAPYRNAADRFWAESALFDWANALRSMNPDDPVLGAQLAAAPKRWTAEDFGSIGRYVGGFIGVLIAVLWGRRRKAKQ